MMSREIILHWTYRNITIGKSPFISIFAMIIVLELACEPIVTSVGRILSLIKFFLPFGNCLSANFYSFYLFFNKIRDVYIQQSSLWQAMFQDIDCNDSSILLCSSKISIKIIIIQRKTNGRNRFNSAFHSSRHGAGIDYIYRRIRTMINP